ncbi:hypothetical protein FHS19_006449 [Paenibacillus rhizosphaerae]|uniref:Uncharacterized protein n=1 Tax=Paenibacillus rhizosphaerae TaxID=297318 RepID=A0A839TXS8_9BACL|nr:hypothetical protein [Paenibacillus rhizosphaerae]MBB3131726.1 hypothetical protein [Paenibacillus rhizosphaerae]
MSILRLGSTESGPIDCRYIQTVDLEITNHGWEPFDMLVQGYRSDGLFYVSLIHADPGQIVPVHGIMTNYTPFELVLVTNINVADYTAAVFMMKDRGNLIAVYTQNDADRFS